MEVFQIWLKILLVLANDILEICQPAVQYFKYYRTVAQIENMRIVYHCFQPQF